MFGNNVSDLLGSVNRGQNRLKMLPQELMSMVTAKTDGELLAAAKVVCDSHREIGVRWDQLIKLSHYKIVLHRYIVAMAGFPGSLDGFFELMKSSSRLSAEQKDFVESVEEQWLSKGLVSEKQAVSLAGMYFNDIQQSE